MSAATRPDPDVEIVPASHSRYALILLLIVYVFNFVDRTLLSILVQPIKEEFGASDTEMGFLTGIAFALFYTVMGIPVARWADRGVRRSIIALALFIWSGMTVLTGFSRSFLHLAIARVGVGIGEAGCSPPAHSLISDYFPADRRATALSVYALGIPIGVGIGYMAGGWLNEFFDWRTAFIVVGMPGVLLSIVVRLTLREPVRGAIDGMAAKTASETISLREVFSHLRSLRSFRHMTLGAALHAFYGYGVSAFQAAFFIRSHGMSTSEIGTWLGMIGFLGGVAGTFLGGYLGDRLAGRDLRFYMWVPAIATLAYLPFGALVYLVPDTQTALLLQIPASVFGGMYLGPTFAMAQRLVPPRMRAMSAALLLFVINIVGLGLGPQGVGLLSDWLAPGLAVESLRYALLTICMIFAVWSVLHYGLAARTLREDLPGVGQVARANA